MQFIIKIVESYVIKKIKERLQQKGLKATPQRIAVYDAISTDNSHPSPETVYNRIHKKFPTISKATVYKILEAFEKNGIVSVISSRYNTIRYDPLTKRHHHLVCRNCNKIVDIIDPGLDNLDIPDQVTKENTLLDFSIHFTVICKECQE